MHDIVMPYMSETAALPSMPQLRGRLRRNVPLGKRCWFGVGGNADWLFTPEDENDLSYFLRHLPRHVPVTVIGVGSNLLVRDGGIDGVVIRLGRGFTSIMHQGHVIHTGAAALDVHVAHYAADQHFTGLEFLVGIPGTIGGAVRMNAGAYGSDLSKIAKDIFAIDRLGIRHVLAVEDAGFAYRRSSLPYDWIVTGVTLKAQPDDVTEIQATMEAISLSRDSTQPVRTRTGGSTFKNPEGYKAWELIDAAGCRGLQHGDAQVSELHCNFLINHGNATAYDLESLGEEVRKRVFEHSGIQLQWEIKRLGKPLPSIGDSI